MDLNFCVREKGTLAGRNPAKKELIHIIAGIVVAIIIILPFIPYIIVDCIFDILAAISTGSL